MHGFRPILPKLRFTAVASRPMRSLTGSRRFVGDPETINMDEWSQYIHIRLLPLRFCQPEYEFLGNCLKTDPLTLTGFGRFVRMRTGRG